ncbi:TPA: hypothetical protein ACV1O4_002733 [Yersinia enterocolitica]|nr:hypothetical protein [Yersinia enterocolitica]HDL6638048.1 hypothetical protein [Yersinia enterocolitica]HDL6660566.1 hypothetical protein [Yersinia enterocolitica]HDL6664054.1 hypothetical protein [Yersinia enterocolitica]HDL6712392.1 hypothetical protein [Yersinia enterocolitica]
MSRTENTIRLLESALQRIIDGKPHRILPSRKLSVRAVEEEANLGNGSCYYYPEFIQKIKIAKYTLTKSDTNHLSKNIIEKIRQSKNEEKRVKIKYREKINELKKLVSQQAAEHHQISHALHLARIKIKELESVLAKTNKCNIITIK